MTTRMFSSADTGAPVLNGQVSTLINVLNACLVDGYNTKTITITRSGSTATATCTAHGFANRRVVTVSGAGESEYNGMFRITGVPDADTFTFEVTGTPATPATGTISCVVSPLGWTKPFTGTNKAAYRNSVADGGTGMYLRVVDSSGYNGSVQVFATMSDVDTGTDVAPLVANFANGLFWNKSYTNDATARTWTLIGDGLTFYLSVISYPADGYFYEGMYCAGDLESDVPGDAWHYTVAGRSSAGSGGGTGYGNTFATLNTGSGGNLSPGVETFWIGRIAAGTGTAVPIQPMGFYWGNGGTRFGDGSAIANPSPSSGNLYFMPGIIIRESTVRGRMRGVYLPVGRLGGVVSGTEYAGVTGLPANSRVTVMRHNTHSFYSVATGLDTACCAAAIENFLDW